jgi:hypothetical protein
VIVGNDMRFCLPIMTGLFLYATAFGVQDKLVSIYQPLADPQGKLVIREIPFISGYAEPEATITSLGKPNRLFQMGPHEVPDSNLVSLFKIKVSCTHVLDKKYAVEFDLTHMRPSKAHNVTEEEVLEAAVICLKLMFGPNSPYDLKLSIKCKQEEEKQWKKYEAFFTTRYGSGRTKLS